jgi:eukaryotic-like serine/threonine-protein kinase
MNALALDVDVPAWIGDYRILDRIAEGGMGIVHRALDTANGRMVAIKTSRSLTPVGAASLRAEAETLKQLNHPGIVRLLADGCRDGVPWMAMELLQGRTLAEEIDAIWTEARGHRGRASSERLTEETPTASERAMARWLAPPARPGRAPHVAAANRLGEAAGIVVQLAMILDHLHARGLVHRDVKPSNVFLRSGVGSGRVTLLDFGLACRANTVRCGGARSLCVGTMHYAAPEQIIGDPVDARADVYSLGCVLYELCTGERPFSGDSDQQVAQKHLSLEPRVPSLLVSGLPWLIEELVMEMLAKNPAKRPASAADAGARLARAMARANV